VRADAFTLHFAVQHGAERCTASAAHMHTPAAAVPTRCCIPGGIFTAALHVSIAVMAAPLNLDVNVTYTCIHVP
jgi:hypothetical protein